MAQTTAQIAVDFARQIGDSEEIFKGNLLLASIYATNGRYARDDSFFGKAHNFLAEAEKVPYSKSLKEEIWFLMTKADVLKQEGRYKEGIEYYNECLAPAASINDDKSRIESLIGKSHCFRLMGSYEDSAKLSGEISRTGGEVFENHKELKAENHHLNALLRVNTNDYSKALEHAQTLLRLSRASGNIEQELIAMNVMAIISGIKSNFKIAAQYFQDALIKSERIGYRYYIAQCLINIATIYAHLYNYNDALERYNRVLDEFKNTLDDQTKVAVFNNVGNIYYSTGRFADAQGLFQKALALANEKNFNNEAALAIAQLSRTFTALDNLEIAEQLSSEAQEKFNSLGNVNGVQINLINSGDILFRQQKYAAAEKKIELGIEKAIILRDDTGQISGFHLLSKIAGAKGDFQTAFEKLSIFTKKKEEFEKQQRSRQFLDLEIKNAIKQKQIEIEQLTKENELQSLLLEKTDQIEKQNRELLSMNEDLRQFAYIASHDLKEPLRMISSYAQILVRLYGDKFDDNAKTYFGYMTEGVTRMNGLLEDLLKYATVGRSEEEIEDLELDFIVEVCRVNLKVLMQETGASLSYGELPIISGQRSMIIQLMQNLISNAIKFRKPDVTPIVTVKSTESEEEYTISVSDNGIGIDKDNIERIFVIFQRLHARTKYEGTGIGLAICQKIVQRIGGRIWVESELNEGSVFYFTIPKGR